MGVESSGEYQFPSLYKLIKKIKGGRGGYTINFMGNHNSFGF